MFFGGIRRSIPSYAQGFGGLFSPHSSTAIGRGLLRRRIKNNIPSLDGRGFTLLDKTFLIRRGEDIILSNRVKGRGIKILLTPTLALPRQGGAGNLLVFIHGSRLTKL